MSGNIIKPPSMGEGNGPVDLPLIFEAVGLPTHYHTQEKVREHIAACVSATFSDGELVIKHPPAEDPIIQEHFGSTTYNEGTFGPRLRALFNGEDIAMRHQVDGLIRASASVLAHEVASGNVSLPQQLVAILTQPNLTPNERLEEAIFDKKPARDVTKPAIAFDRQVVELDRPPHVVVDYGPGLQGRFHIDRQLADWTSGAPPYTYLAVGKGPFANEFLQQYWAARLGDDPQLFRGVIGRLYIGREDGIAAATTEFAAAQKQHTGTSEFADLVVASGIQTAGYDEVGAGLANAHKLLKPDGTLLIRAPKAVNLETPTSVPAEAMVEMALQAGFDRSKAQFFDTVTKPDVGPRTASLSVVFRK